VGVKRQKGCSLETIDVVAYTWFACVMTSAIDTQKQMMMMGFPFSDLHLKGDKSFGLPRECHFRPCSRTNLNLNDIVFSISIFCAPKTRSLGERHFVLLIRPLIDSRAWALIEIYEQSSWNEIKALILNLLTDASQTNIPSNNSQPKWILALIYENEPPTSSKMGPLMPRLEWWMVDGWRRWGRREWCAETVEIKSK